MSDIVKECSLKAVSFEKQKGLTRGQQAIYDILVKKAIAGEILTRDDMSTVYLSVETRWYRVWDYRYNGRQDSQVLSKRELMMEDYETRRKAIQWFKSNLATCIIKGKIMAIPVIEDSD